MQGSNYLKLVLLLRLIPGFNPLTKTCWWKWLLNMQKRPLIRTVKIFSLIFIFAVLWIFVRSAGPDWSTQNPEVSLDLSKVSSGQVELLEAAGKVYYLIQPDTEILENLNTLQSHTWQQPKNNSYTSKAGIEYIIVSAYGAGGCLLRHFNKSEFNNQAGNQHTWFGGFVDLCDRLSYDYSGRLIKTADYSYHGLATQKDSGLEGAEITSQVKKKIYIKN